jgi:hypothetical protein
MSSDGATIVAGTKNVDGKCEASRWDGGTDWTLMGSEPGALPCGSSLSSPYDTNNDTAVGLFWRAQICKAIGGTWDVVAGVAGPELTSTVPNRPTRGNAITDDGTIVGGWQDNTFGSRQAVLWVNGIQEYVTDDEGNLYGEIIGMNSDATVMWGTSYQYDGTGRGWLYREGEFIPMGSGGIGRNIQSVPFAGSEDGSVIVGTTRDYDQFIETPWIWTAKKGYQTWEDFLKGQTGAGWQLVRGTVVSADGLRIAGDGLNPDGRFQAWILDLKASGKPGN